MPTDEELEQIEKDGATVIKSVCPMCKIKKIGE